MTVALPDLQALLEEGAALHRRGDIDGAAERYAQILERDRQHPDALHLGGLAALQRGDSTVALELVQRSLRLRPDYAPTHGTLALVLSSRGMWTAARAEFRRAVALDPSLREVRDNLVFSVDLDPYATKEDAREVRREYDRVVVRPLLAQARPHRNDRSTDRKLRIGYVSSDFRLHSAATAAYPIIRHHDTDRFEVYLYSTTTKPDAVTERFEDIDGIQWRNVDDWVDTGEQPDAVLADMIRSDGIDVLVDLAGFSGGNRIGTFARKPAPVQIMGWGYLADTTGLSCYDGILCDAVTLPEGDEDGFTERPIRLPAFMAYEPLIPTPEVGPPPVERNGYVTFGCFGRAHSLNEDVLVAWAEILKRSPTSRLLLKSQLYEDEACTFAVVDALVARGIPDHRIEVRGASTPEEHAAAYNDVDIALDTWPQGGGTTTAEATYMGVPTVTLLGDRMGGRKGASIASLARPSACGLNRIGWVSVAGYIRHAASKARFVQQTAHRPEMRQSTRWHLQASPFMDYPRLARAFEDAAVEMFARWAKETA